MLYGAVRGWFCEGTGGSYCLVQLVLGDVMGCVSGFECSCWLLVLCGAASSRYCVLVQVPGAVR